MHAETRERARKCQRCARREKPPKVIGMKQNHMRSNKQQRADLRPRGDAGDERGVNGGYDRALDVTELDRGEN